MNNTKEGKNKRMSESFRLGALLTLVGGFLDAYTYVSRGKVFANAQTGNILLMGMNVAQGEFLMAFMYFIPILAFAIGIILVELIKDKCKDDLNTKFHWRQIIILLEIVVLVTVAFVPSGTFNTAVNIAISFVCSIQVESFRKIRGNAYATTMCTGNLRSAAENTYIFLKTKESGAARIAWQYYSIIIFFIIGAVIGMYTTNLFGEKSVLLCAVLLIFSFFLMFKDGDKEHRT